MYAMLKSVAVSRQGPRSMATTFSPASVSCWARMAPVQPRPMITASLRGSTFANSHLSVDGDRALGIWLVVLVDMVPVVVARPGKANHLPTRHVLVAAIERVGKEAFHSVLQHQLEKFLGAEAGLQFQLDLAAVQTREHHVLLLHRQRAEVFLVSGVGVVTQRPQTEAIAPRRREIALIAL